MGFDFAEDEHRIADFATAYANKQQSLVRDDIAIILKDIATLRAELDAIRDMQAALLIELRRDRQLATESPPAQ